MIADKFIDIEKTDSGFAFFLYKKKDLEFKDLRWALKASDRKRREHLGCLKVEEERYYCTDGKRVHIVNKKISLLEGIYNIFKISESSIQLIESDKYFPNIDLVRDYFLCNPIETKFSYVEQKDFFRKPVILEEVKMGYAVVMITLKI